MRILGIYTADYPWDVRIEKVFGGLVAAGHQVSLVSRNLKRRPAFEEIGGMRCLRVPGNIFPSLLQALVSIPAFFSPIWLATVLREGKRIDAQLVIVRDLPLALLGIFVARRLGVACWVDMAENHPEMWREVLRKDPWKVGSFLLKNHFFGKWMERQVARSADLIFVVVEEMRDHLVSLGGDPNRVMVVSNSPAVIPEENPRSALTLGEPLNIVFTGFVTERRGLRVVMEALALLKNFEQRVVLHIIGSGDADDVLRNYAEQLGVAASIVWHGWVDHQSMHDLLDIYDIGIVPHPKTGEIEYTVPNKLFDYMAHSLPVIVSDARPLMRIVEQESCGFVFADGNAESLAAVIRQLADVELRRCMGRKGREAVISRYHWNNDFSTILLQIANLDPESLSSTV